MDVITRGLAALKRAMPPRGEDPQLSKFLSMLKWQGLWFFKDQQWSPWRVWQLIRLTWSFPYPLLIIYALSKISGEEVLTNPSLSFVGFGLATNIFLAIFFFKQHTLQDFISGIQEIAERSPQEFEAATALPWKYIHYTTTSVWVFVGLFSGAPILGELVLWALGAPEPLPIPRPWESFTPRVRSVWFYLLNLAHLLLSASSVNSYGGVLTCLPAVACYVHFELRALVRELEAWARDPHRRKGALHRIARRHSEILRLVTEVKTIIGPCCALQNFISSISISLLLHFAKKAFLAGEYIVVVQNLYTVSFQVACTYLSCFIGETLRSEGLRIREALYESKWEEESPATRRILLQMAIAARKEIIIDFKNKLPLKLESFTELMNTSYSIFMLMESFE